MAEIIVDRNDEEIFSSNSNKTSGKFKELFNHITSDSANLNIKITDINKEGDVKLEVMIKDLGLTYQDLVKYKNEFIYDATANFLGELLVRENIHKFINIMKGFKNEYSNKVNKYEFRQFGLVIYKDRLILIFHISLVQQILVEDFRKKV